jgi:uncharacterized protein (DUF3820 family)
MKIYATYKILEDIKPEYAKDGKAGKLQLRWTNVSNDCGQPMPDVFSNTADIFKKVKFGNRYVIEFKQLEGNRILYPTRVRLTNKNLKCGVIRKYEGEYIFINGKYKGKTLKDIDKYELNNYLLWLGKHTNNEATVINILDILKIINNEKF